MLPMHAFAQTTWFVDAAATGANDGSSWADAYTKLQDALAAAAGGDQIWVARGVYYPDEGVGKINDDRAATFALKNGVGIYGGFAGGETSLSQRNSTLNVTVLSGDIDKNDTTDANGVSASHANLNGNNSYHVVTGSGTNATALLDGFTITGGLANAGMPGCGTGCGGGVYNDAGSPTLVDLVVSGNSSVNAGGGIANINGSNPTLTGALVIGNRASQGGGMANLNNSSPTISEAQFERNLAQVGSGGNGGGMFNLNNSAPQLAVVVFLANEALVNGGGMMNQNGSSARLERVAFLGNVAGFGGGLYNLSASHATLVNSVFSGNLATRSGGGGGGALLNNGSSPTLTNVTVTGNTAGGTVQTGGGMVSGANSQPVLVNTIFWGNNATTDSEISNSGGSVPQISFSIVQGSGGSGSGWNSALGADGGGNLDVDPLFVDADGADNTSGTADDDLRLRSGSPAIDAGNNAAPGLAGVFTDASGGLRFLEDPLAANTGLGAPPIVDIGAFEFRRGLFTEVPLASGGGLLVMILALFALATGVLQGRRGVRRPA
jgi:hypothetical protein